MISAYQNQAQEQTPRSTTNNESATGVQDDTSSERAGHFQRENFRELPWNARKRISM